MDCFDAHYYRLSKKLTKLVGLWPYQSRSEKAKKWIVFLPVIALQVLLQGGQAMNSELTYEYCIEFISESLVTILVSIRYLGNTINNEKIKGLLENIRVTWRSLAESDERDAFCQSVEDGRLYIVHYAMIMCWLLLSDLFLLLTSPLLTYTSLTNASCPFVTMYFPDLRLVDPQAHCYPILFCVASITLTVMITLYAIDTMLITLVHHAIAMFRLVCYRLEHLFDDRAARTKPSSGRTRVCEKLASAVECHRAAVRFSDDIVAAYGWTNLVSLILSLAGVAVTLYWTIMAKGQTVKTWINLSIGVGQLFDIFLLGVPAQRMIDNSEAVTFKAYSSLWYTAHVKEQSLILLTMQRGLKPSAIILGGIYATSLENFAGEVKASFSYLTMLMSLG